MSEWRETKLGSLGKVITGKTPSKDNPEDWGDAVLFVTPSDYKNYRKKADSSLRMLSVVGADRQKQRLLPAQSVLVTCIGSDMGKTVVNALPCVTNQQINAIIPNESVIDPDYLYYITKDLYSLLSSLGSDGTAVPILNKSDFENIDIVIPAPEVQKSIATVLSSLDDKIDLLHRQNKTLEAMAETLFRQWFVEGAGDWSEGKLGDYFDISSGKGLKRERFLDAGMYPVLGANGEIGRTNEFLLEEKLIYTGRVGALGNIFILNGEKVWLSDNTLVFRNIKSFYFVYFSLKNADLAGYNCGSTQPLIRQSDVKEIPMPSPPIELLAKFEECCLPLFNRIGFNEKQIANLEKLLDSLLPKLMSGEVRVAHA